MKYKVEKETGVDNSKETKLLLIDGRFLCAFKETLEEVKPFVDMILNHIPYFWNGVDDETTLQRRIIDDDKNTLMLDPDDFSSEDWAYLKRCGGELKVERDYDGLIDVTYNDSFLEKYDNRYYIEAGSTLELKSFDDSGLLYQVTSFYDSDITRFHTISDGDALEESRAMEINIGSEIYDRIIALGIHAEYNKRFGDITIINSNSKYRIIRYNDCYYMCLTEIHFSRLLSDDAAILSAIIVKIFKPLFYDSQIEKPIINDIFQPTLNDYVSSIKQGGNVFSLLKNLTPVYTKEGKLIVSRFGDTVDFKMKDNKTNKVFALKAFTKDIKRLTEKYKAIESFFSKTQNPIFFVIPKVYDNELSINTGIGISKIPVVLTEWVSGVSLYSYVQKCYDDKIKMNLLAQKMAITFSHLRHKEYAHGNINPRNIYLDSFTDAVHLYDYDNMIIPNCKDGIIKQCDTNYSYPYTISYNGENADDFAMITILLSLKAICIDSSLCDIEKTSSSLVFRQNDFTNVVKSTITSKLPLLLEDADFRKLYSLFIGVLDNGFLLKEQVKNLSLSNPYESEGISLYNDGEVLRKSGDYEESAKKYKEAAMRGNVEANRKLAILVMGSLIHADSKLRTQIGIWYYKKNLIYNDHISAFNLGVIYTLHDNYREAIKYFMISARLGNAIAMCNISYAYEKGLGVEQNMEKAENYLLRASESNNGIARDIVLNSVYGLEPYYEIIDSY